MTPSPMNAVRISCLRCRGHAAVGALLAARCGRSASAAPTAALLYPLAWIEPDGARDDFTHDLRTARINSRNACVCVHATDWVFVHVAIAAMQLQAGIGYTEFEFTREQFRLRRIICRQIARISRIYAGSSVVDDHIVAAFREEAGHGVTHDA